MHSVLRYRSRIDLPRDNLLQKLKGFKSFLCYAAAALSSSVKLLSWRTSCPLSYYIKQKHFLLAALVRVMKLHLGNTDECLQIEYTVNQSNSEGNKHIHRPESLLTSKLKRLTVFPEIKLTKIHRESS